MSRIVLAPVAALAFAAGACVFTLGPIEQVKPSIDAEVVDAPADASTDGPCDPTKPFQQPTRITALDTDANDELWPRLTPDELTMVFSTKRAPANAFGAFITTRSARDAEWAAPTSIDGISAAGAFDSDPMITPDGDRLFFASNRGGGSADIYSATRDRNGAFVNPLLVPELNTNADEFQPFVAFDGSEIWLTRVIANQSRILRAESNGGTIAQPNVVPELTSTGDDWLPTPSADGLTLYFASTRPGGKGDYDIWVARRPTKTSPFERPSIVDELDGPALDAPGWLSVDGCRLYFHRCRESTSCDLFLAEKPK